MRLYIRLLRSYLFALAWSGCIIVITDSATGCRHSEQQEVRALTARVKDDGVRGRLVAWVDENVKHKTIDVRALQHGESARPGDYVLPLVFDWSLLGMRNHPGQEVRLVTAATGEPEAVFFGNSRMGVVVSLNGQFGLAESDLKRISDSVAVYSATDE